MGDPVASRRPIASRGPVQKAANQLPLLVPLPAERSDDRPDDPPKKFRFGADEPGEGDDVPSVQIISDDGNSEVSGAKCEVKGRSILTRIL